jgi:parvulin-like peptidyl-prolyl isomerase
MSQAITITSEDILHQVKLSCKIPSVIEEIVTRKIIASAAAEAGIKVETEELQKAADNIRLMGKLKSADDTWAWLQKHGLSLDDFEELIYNNVISGKLAQHLFADKVEPFFVEHQLDYAGVVMYEVVLDDEDLAMELFYGIQEGEMSFYEVAHQYIQDTELRRKGGYRGIVRARS